MDSRNTRQQIYDRIRASTKDDYILEEMKRLGFWEKSGEKPSLSEEMIKKESDLQKQINALLAEKQRYQNRDEVLKDMRRKRMDAAKEKRKLTKEKREQERQSKAAAWADTKEKDIIFLGEGVSAGLSNEEGNHILLQSRGLPVFNDINALATACGLTIGAVKFLSFHRQVATTTHYKRFSVPKKSGGRRVISAPMPRLKSLQYWILHNILDKVPLHNAANGFVTNKSILTNAVQHTGKDVVVNIDLKDFFPTIDYKRVKGIFVKLGYAEKIATVLALICTEPDREELALDGKTYYAATGKRVLPQGAPTSPAITNIICYKLDRRLNAMAAKLQYNYTRYADDMSFSKNGDGQIKSVQQLIWRVKRIITDERFIVHPDKINVMHKGSRQEVTGIVVNKQMGINQKTLHRFRATIHQIDKHGLANAKWKGGNIMAEMMGYANFVMQVKPAAGQKLKLQLKEIFSRPAIIQQMQQLGLPLNPVAMAKPKSDSTQLTPPKNNNEPGKDWWNVL